MLQSLHIQNYRNLKNFRMKSLDQVNLITGRNNTGKSILLEAIRIYASKGNLLDLEQIVENHGEFLRQRDRTKNTESDDLKTLSSLFTNRTIGFNAENSILIGELAEDIFGNSTMPDGSVIIQFVRYIDETQKDASSNLLRRRVLIGENNIEADRDFKIGFKVTVKGANSEYLYPLDNFNFRRFPYGENPISDSYQFIKTGNIDREINGKLFDDIALTDKEKYVIEALKIIEPETERVAFIEKDARGRRDAIIKLKGSKDVYPLKSMGDGINRILTIILALVNCENGFLMIDEFENGLHYSVQEQLWKIIFKLSKELDIQVFATTHSEDCIKGFQRTINDPQNSVSGKLIRMDSIDGIIKQTQFSPDELKIADEQDIEVR